MRVYSQVNGTARADGVRKKIAPGPQLWIPFGVSVCVNSPFFLRSVFWARRGNAALPSVRT